MVTNSTLKKHVEDALSWAAGIDESQIGVVVSDGVVTLAGYVPSYYQRIEAERAAKRVYGVKGLANDLEVDLPGDAHRTDAEIAKAALAALKGRITVPKDKVQVTVRNGWVTLEGKVPWRYQRESAYDAVRHLAGVKGVDNEVTIVSAVKAGDVKAKIEAALVRDARLEASKIRVETKDHKVILRGTVDSFDDLEEAESAAWSAPGVWDVEDELVVEF